MFFSLSNLGYTFFKGKEYVFFSPLNSQIFSSPSFFYSLNAQFIAVLTARTETLFEFERQKNTHFNLGD